MRRLLLAKVLDVLAADREKGVNDLAGKAAATKLISSLLPEEIIDAC